MAGYVGWRLGFTVTPSTFERSSGFLFQRLDPPELERLFGDNLLTFRLYNVMATISSVLFSEPRHGVWIFVRDWLAGSVRPSTWINLASSVTVTVLIVWYVVDRVRIGVRAPQTLGDRQVIIFFAILAANGVLTFGYAKDDIMNPAGACYGVAAFAAASYLLHKVRARPPRGPALVALCLVFAATSLAWSIRAATVHQVLRATAHAQRNDWARVERVWEAEGRWDVYGARRDLVRRLRSEALDTRVPSGAETPRIVDRVTDEDY